ncbi:MAG: DUF4957 domain-containing protein [Prolixibacteraceae bacterium]
MKLFLITTFYLLFTWSLVYGQTVHQVNTTDNALYSAVMAASDGDILELTQTGKYRIDSLIIINKKLTIRAAESLTTRPILQSYYPSTSARYIFAIGTGGNLTLEGLDLDGMAGSDSPAENLIQTAAGITGNYSLFVDDCYLHDADQGEKGSVLRSYSNTYADTVKFTNSVLYNIGKIGIRINESDNCVDYFEFSNSSMFNVWAEGIYVQGNAVVFRVDHCTFNNVGWGTAEILRPRFITDAIVTNSIFSNTPEPRTRAMLMYGTSTIDYCAFYEVGDINVHSVADFIMGDNITLDVDPQYFNVAFNDFSLLATSPLLTYAEDGGTIGDPNWPNNRPFIPAIISVGTAKNALYDSLQSARSGDILELTDAGEYQLDSILNISKEITIRAAADLESKPVIQLTNAAISTRYIFEIKTGGLLRLQGLDIDGMAGSDSNAKYLIRTDEAIEGSYSLYVDDCILHDVASGTSDGNFFRAYADTYADNVIFTNSILFNSGGEGIRIKDKANTVKYFEISNSTMYRTAEEGIYVQGDAVEFVVNYCTFNDLGYNGYKFVRPRDILNADIKNSIFSNRTSTSSTIEVYGGEVDYCDFYNVGSVTYNSAVTVGENILDVDPVYADAANDDFSLLKTSPLYYISEDYTALGDPRWAVNVPDFVGNVILVGLERNALYDSLMIAEEGDILELTESGDYLLDSLIDIDKTITVRAAGGLASKPVIKFVNPEKSTIHLFQIVTGGSLHLIGLELDGLAGSETPTKYILKTADEIEGSYSLIVEDCILHDVDTGDNNGNFFRAYSKTYADTVIFDNCILYNAGREGIRIKDADNTVGYFQLSNSTMYNTYIEGVYVQGANVIARIDHCTFDNLGYAHNEFVRLRYIADAEVTNCIFSNAETPPSRCMLFYGSLLSNCNFYEVGSVSGASDSYVSLWKNYDPVYEDVATGNFTLLETSPMYLKGTDGEALGDLRWATNEPTDPRYTVSFTVLTENDSLALVGASVFFNNQTILTDANGVVVFESIAPVTDAVYSIVANDFEDASGTITVTNDNVAEIALMTAGTYTVTFIVKGKNDALLEGATVVFNNKIVSTGVDGTAAFDSISPIANALYLVSADSYENAIGYINVTDTDVIETVTVSSSGNSVSETMETQFVVYPNPASDYINLTLPDDFVGTVDVLNSTGQKLDNFNVSNTKNMVLDTDSYSNGMYFLRLSNHNINVSKCVILNK